MNYLELSALTGLNEIDDSANTFLSYTNLNHFTEEQQLMDDNSKQQQQEPISSTTDSLNKQQQHYNSVQCMPCVMNKQLTGTDSIQVQVQLASMIPKQIKYC